MSRITIISPTKISVTCFIQYKLLEGIFDVGDVVEIEPIVTKYDIHTSCPTTEKNKIPAGTYDTYRIKSKNGHYYSESVIRNFIGYVPLSKIFKKNTN